MSDVLVVVVVVEIIITTTYIYGKKYTSFTHVIILRQLCFQK